MSKKVVEYCMCDICGKEGAKSYDALAYRTYSATDFTERYDPPRFESVHIDLCDECACKVTALLVTGLYAEEYKIEPIK